MVYCLVRFVCLKPPILNTCFPCSKSWVFSDFLGFYQRLAFGVLQGAFLGLVGIYIFSNDIKRSTDTEYKGQVKIFDAGIHTYYTNRCTPLFTPFLYIFFHILMGRGVAPCLIRFKILCSYGIKQNAQDEALFSPILAFSVFLCNNLSS